MSRWAARPCLWGTACRWGWGWLPGRGSLAAAGWLAQWEELLLEGARRRDELESGLPPLPPYPPREVLDHLQQACPALGGFALQAALIVGSAVSRLRALPQPVDQG